MIATATILTRDSAGILTTIHDRMPIALEPQDYDRWLDPSKGDGAALIAEVSETAAHTASHCDHYEVVVTSYETTPTSNLFYTLLHPTPPQNITSLRQPMPQTRRPTRRPPSIHAPWSL